MLGLVGLSLLTAGCEALGPAAARPELRDDIVAIQQYPPTDPWLRDENGRAAGLQSRVYFLPVASGEQMAKGVFVSGTIKASLYAMLPRADGTYTRELAYEWSFDSRAAEGFRIRRPSVMGESYGLILRWPATLDLSGREVQLVYTYERKDGEVITRRGSRFRVPLPLRMSVPGAPTTVPAPGAQEGAASRPARPRPGPPGSP
jgi:hypothetical protein